MGEQVRDKKGRTPLHLTTFWDELDDEFSGEFKHQADYESEKKLLTKHRKDHWDVAKTLLANKANSEARDKDGWAPIHYCVYSDIEMLKLLIEAKADINVKGHKKVTPLHLIVARRKTNSIGIGKLLIAHKADVNAQDENEETPFQWAYEWGTQDFAELLLENGADPNSKDQSGKTILRRLIENYERIQPEIKDELKDLYQSRIDFLRKHGAHE